MSEKTKTVKQVCRCESCGNEAEMKVTCSWEDFEREERQKAADPPEKTAAHRVKGTATCSHCGNEADMWIDV